MSRRPGRPCRLTPHGERRLALDISAVALAKAAHVTHNDMARPGPEALQRMDAVLRIVEAGGTLEYAASTIPKPASKPQGSRPDMAGPAWPDVTDSASGERGLSGRCFGGDSDPGDGGIMRVCRPATHVETASALGGE